MLAILLLSLSSFAQPDSTQTRVDRVIWNVTSVDGCTMRRGKMMTLTNGKLSPMLVEMCMFDGTKVTIKGMCTRNDGTKVEMNDGDHIAMSGVIRTLNDSKDL